MTITSHPEDQSPSNGGHVEQKTAIRQLSRVLRKGGFDIAQVAREAMVAIYRQTKPGTSVEDYEVIVIGRTEAGVFKGKPYEAKETYPNNGSWGVRGWTYRTKEDAMAKFFELVQRKEAA